MQIASVRNLVLSAVLLAGAGAYALVGGPIGAGSPRWPTADSVYATDSWSVSPEKVEHINTADFISRDFRKTDGTAATLTIETYQSPKLYAAGAEVPFLGSGYTVTTPSADFVPEGSNIGALVAAQGAANTWLVMYAYGERRGMLGNGPVPWTFAIADGLLGHPNDYYKLYLSARSDGTNPTVNHDLSDLAASVFPRISAWYGA